MTQGIGGYSRAYDWNRDDGHTSIAADAAASRGGTAAREMCVRADTVFEGFLCEEPSVVSAACRSPKNEVDRYVCDDKKMADLQQSVWDTTKDVLKTLFGAFAGALAKK